jgi:hypothetical protein
MSTIRTYSSGRLTSAVSGSSGWRKGVIEQGTAGS